MTQTNSQNRADKRIAVISQFVIFGLFLLFFLIINPIIPYDADDWTYLSRFRIPLPLISEWNPTKVLPETLMPFVGWSAGHIFYPILNDYVFSVTVAGGILLALFVSLFGLGAYIFSKVRLKFSAFHALYFEIVMLLFLFTIFRNRPSSNSLFTGENFNCVFNYIIPGFVNGTAVLFLMSRENYQEHFYQLHVAKKVLMVFLLYAAMFSNIYHSAILAIYCGVYLLQHLIGWLQEKSQPFGKMVCDHLLYLILLAIWLVSLILESNGGRAASVREFREKDYFSDLMQLRAMIKALAKPFVAGFVILAVLVLVMLWKDRKIKNKSAEIRNGILNQTKIALFCGMLMTIYLLLLNSVLGYMSRIDATWGMWFYLILVYSLMIAWIISRFPRLQKAWIPVILVMAAFAYFPDGKYGTSSEETYETCSRIDHYLVNQLIQADQEQKEPIEFVVPDYRDTDLSWEMGGNMGNLIGTALVNAGIIDRIPEYTTVYSSELLSEMSQN
jgi:hypothetical protein